MNYLAEQVLHAQPSEIQEFLGVTAGLERFCASLCDELRNGVMSSPSSDELIRELDRRNLFIVRLDPNGEWYRYHHLFRQLLLRRRAQLVGTLDWRIVSRRAGQWFADNGEVEEAISYWIDSGDTKAAADLVWRNMAETLEADISRRTLRRWLAAFPPASLKEHTALLIAEAFIKALSYDWSGIAELVDLAEDRLKQELPSDADCSRDEMLGVARALQSARHFWQGNIECSLRNAELALQALPPRQITARIAAHQYLAGCMTVMGQRSEALHYLKEVEISDAASGSRNVAPLLVAQAFIHLLSANFEEALGCVSRMEELQATVGLIDYWLIDAYFIRGCEALERNRLAEAEAEFNKAIPYRYSVNARHYHEILIGLAKVSLARGFYADALERLKAARAFALEACDPGSTRISESMEARLAFARGKNISCETFKAVATDAVSFWMEVPTVTYAELKLHQAKSEAELQLAIAFIDEALENARSQGTVRQIIVLSLLNALAFESLGYLDTGIWLLETAVEMARPLELLRTFLERGPRLGKLLVTLAGKKSQDDYVRGLSEIFRGHPANPEAGLDEVTGSGLLSDRELDVLHLMSKRKRNKEIAAELHISYETVKNHAKNIYRKLGVHSRREAVAQAQALGLDTST
jgi:LuxR family maltose regulon positive regulatory protein